jgi:HEAT repeat protein
MPLFGPPVKGLIRALQYQKVWKVRMDAAIALGEIGDVRAVNPLIEVLADPDYRVRREAARGLGEIGDARAVDPLIKTLSDKERRVREVAIKSLEKLGEPVGEPLINAHADLNKEEGSG